MKNLVLVVGLLLVCAVGSAQEKGRDIPSRGPAGSAKSVAKAVASSQVAPAVIIGRVILVPNKIGEDQPLPRQSRQREPIQKVINPPKAPSNSKKSSNSQARRPGCSRC